MERATGVSMARRNTGWLREVKEPRLRQAEKYVGKGAALKSETQGREQNKQNGLARKGVSTVEMGLEQGLRNRGRNKAEMSKGC